MDIEHYRQKLLAKEAELVADVGQAKAEVREQAEPGVQDEADLAVQSEVGDTLLNQTSLDADLLQQVRDALRRIDEGTYGKCLVCGRPIEEKRLEAVPWAAYDVQHQAQVDRAQGRPRGGSTL
jgi:DnaK suppressor protein